MFPLHLRNLVKFSFFFFKKKKKRKNKGGEPTTFGNVVFTQSTEQKVAIDISTPLSGFMVMIEAFLEKILEGSNHFALQKET